MRVRRMNTRRAMWTAAVCLAATLAGGPGLRAAQTPKVLDQAPEGAEAVLVVPNLSEFSQKLSTLKQTMNLPAPQLSNALGAFKQATGMAKGLNDNGAMMMVSPDFAEAMTDHHKVTFLLLVPVSDYQAFVSNFGGQAGEGPASIKLPGGESGFAKKVGDYAVMGEDQATVKSYQPGHAANQIAQKVGELGRKYLQQSDAMLYLNMAKVGPALAPLIEKRYQQMKGEMEGLGHSGGPSANAPTGEANGLAKAIARNATGLIIGVDLNKQGIGITNAMGYKAGSTLAQLFPGQQGGKAEGNLNQLPANPYILAFSVDGQAVAMDKLADMLQQAVPQKQLQGAKQALQAKNQLLRQTRAFAGALYPPGQNAMMGGNVLNAMMVIDSKNPKTYVKQFKQYIQATNGAHVSMPSMDHGNSGDMNGPLSGEQQAAPGSGQGDAGSGGNQGGGSQITYHTSYQDNALQIQGAQVDQYQVRTQMPPKMMQKMGPLARFLNTSGYIAQKNGKVVLTTAADPQLITQGFQALQNQQGIGASQAMQQLPEGALPSNPAARGYLSLDGIAQGANMFIGMMGVPPIQPPKNLPPLAAGLGVQGNSLAVRTYLPSNTVKFIVDTAQKLKQQMSGARRGQRPGAGPRGRQGGQPGGRGMQPGRRGGQRGGQPPF